MNEQATKKAYETPKLTVHGDVAALTLAALPGGAVDAIYTRGNNRSS